jgi:PiT family inorganic phosphate transporter
MGIGASERPKAVRWGKAKEIFSVWIITMPSAAVVSIVVYGFLRLMMSFFG